MEELKANNRAKENFALEVLGRIDGNIARTNLAEALLSSVITMIPKIGLSSEPIVFETLRECGNSLSEAQKETVMSHLKKFIDGGVQEIVFLIGHLGAYLRMTPPASLRHLIESYRRRNLQEKQQILSAAQPQVSAIDETSRLQILEGLADHIKGANLNDARFALKVIKENASVFPTEEEKKRSFFKILLERVGDDQCQVRKETLILIGEMMDFWKEDKNLFER